MDHLPIYLGNQGRLFSRIPRVGHVRYDKEGFHGFLERLGTSAKALVQVPPDDPSELTMISIVQEWLIFALMHETGRNVGVEIDLDPLLDGASGSYITFRSLPAFARNLIIHRHRTVRRPETDFSRMLASHSLNVINLPGTVFLSESDLEIEREKVTSCLTIAVGFLEELLEAYPSVKDGGPGQSTALRLNLIISVSCLVKSLNCIYSTVLEHPLGLKTYGPCVRDLFVAHMVNGGWCPSHVEHISYLDTLELWAASTLPSHDKRSHTDCSALECVEKSGNMPDHAVGCSGCPVTSVDEASLVQILNEGSIPVLQLIEDHGQLAATPLSSKQNPLYIAISHVWSQGLGNPSANSLPSCQIRLLVSHMSSFGDVRPALWLDTLCIPVSEHYRKSRELAIERIRETYMNAKYVLVVDRRLRLVPSDLWEQRLQLLCSEWMRRLWTLQESILPQPDQVYVQFADQTINLRTLLARPLQLQICHDLEQTTRVLLWHRFDVAEINGPNRLLRMARHFQARQTTKLTDEAICLATLMDIPLSRFPSMPNMQQVLESLPELPEDLIFVPGPRIQSPKWQWAPSSFLAQPNYEFGHSSKTGVLCDRGFKISMACILFREPIRLGPALSIRFTVIDEKGQPICIFHLKPVDEISPYFAPRIVDSPALIISGSHLQKYGVGQGALVGVKENAEGTIYCHYEERINIQKYDSLPSTWFLNYPPYVQVPGEWKDECTWCVD